MPLTFPQWEGVGCYDRQPWDIAAMCSCQQHSGTAAKATSAPEGAISFRVEDMTCGHCAGTIKKAIEDQLPGTAVTADPASKLVSVVGAADFSAIRSIVAGAGYTPGADRIG